MNQEEENYYIYFKKIDGTYRTINSITNELKTFDHDNKPSKHMYTMLARAGYSATDAGLAGYLQDFKVWIKELRCNKILSVRYTKYYTDNSAVKMTFNRLSKGNMNILRRSN